MSLNSTQLRSQLAFYLTHSMRDLLRNGGRTIFALFCIATGVAAVVALRSLALMIGDELTTNLAELNRGDIRIVVSDDLEPGLFDLSGQGNEVLTPEGVAAFEDWASDEDVDIQFASILNFVQVLPLDENEGLGSPFSVVAILIEPDEWPYYGAVFSSEPSVSPLNELFADDAHGIVISRRVALDNGIEVGDAIRVGGGQTELTVSAFVDDEAEGSLLLRNGPTGLLGFIYYPLDAAQDIGLEPRPDSAYIQIDLGRDVADIDESLQERFGEDISRVTTIELEEENAEVADLISDLILVMGLSSVLIGGIGIINTMLVIVGRRTLEIAVLKTMGLKAWRVTALFLTEAALMGIIGSVVGVILGIIGSYAVRNVGEDVLGTSLAWRAYPDAWFSGLTLGFVITVAFGLLPTLIAGQVRPATVLRPNEVQLPNAGLLRTMSAIVVIIVVFGLTLNIIVSGRLDLPFTLMLGLGGFILGLFGGIMFSNQEIMQPVEEEYVNTNVTKHGLALLVFLIACLLLVTLFALDTAFFNVNDWLLFGLPLLIGAFGGYFFRNPPDATGIPATRASQQITIVGGALIFGGIVGGGLVALIQALIIELYPNGGEPGYFETLQIISGVIGLVAALGFRRWSQRAARTIGSGLIGAASLTALGIGIGRFMTSIFEGTAFWDGVERFTVGIIVVELLTVALGGTFVVLWGVVWIIGKFPSFKNVDVKISLRNITNRKSRTASTMIGLIAGVGALSLITLTTSAVTTLLETRIETDLGGNVLVVSLDPTTSEAVAKRLDERLEGVKSYTQFEVFEGRLIEVDGEEPEVEGAEAGDAADGNRREIGAVEGEPGIGLFFTSVDTTRDVPDYDMQAGRFFTEDDLGQPVMVIREPFPGTLFDQFNIKVGSEVKWLLTPPPSTGLDDLEVTYTIIGIIDRESEQSGFDAPFQIPAQSVPPGVSASTAFTVADIEEPFVDAALIEFSQLSNVLPLDTSVVVQLIERLLDQLVAIPTLVAILALIAGAVIIANTVALDTQERRRQIGVMRAIGLKGYRVLAQLIFENALIGLIAGLLGVGIGVIATLLVGVLGDADQVNSTLELAPAGNLIIMAILVSVGATLISAWTASREKPMAVLRYE